MTTEKRFAASAARKKALETDGLITPSEVLLLIEYSDYLSDLARDRAAEIDDLRQQLDDLRHTRHPYV